MSARALSNDSSCAKGKLTGSFVEAAFRQNAGNTSVVDCVVVGLDAPADGIVKRAVSRLLRRIVKTLERALGHIVGTI